jgi:hypothetical protein
MQSSDHYKLRSSKSAVSLVTEEVFCTDYDMGLTVSVPIICDSCPSRHGRSMLVMTRGPSVRLEYFAVFKAPACQYTNVRDVPSDHRYLFREFRKLSKAEI